MSSNSAPLNANILYTRAARYVVAIERQLDMMRDDISLGQYSVACYTLSHAWDSLTGALVRIGPNIGNTDTRIVGQHCHNAYQLAHEALESIRGH